MRGVDRGGRIVVALLVLLICGLVATGIATGSSKWSDPALAQVDGKLLVCDRLPGQAASPCHLASEWAAIRISFMRRDHRSYGLWESPHFGGVLLPGHYTAFGTLNGVPIRRASVRLTLAHPTHLVLVADAIRT
jgi:hypothetical protein